MDARSDEPREFRLLTSEVVIGHGEDNQFVIRRPTVSRRHASVAFRKHRFEVSDLGSTNGTFVNGRRIRGPTPIEVGDELRIGDATFVVTKPAGAGGSSSGSKTTTAKKMFTLRGAVEAMLLAFAVGFGAAQFLAYFLYHEQNQLILAEAEPINQGGKAAVSAATPSQPSQAPPQAIEAHAASTPTMAARPSAQPPPKSARTEEVGAKEFGGGVALARLIAGSGSEAGRTAPDFQLAALDRSKLSLSGLRGKVVLLNFWATWCGACRSEMPSLEDLYRDFRSNSDFAVVTISVSGRGAAPVAQFMEKNGYDFPVLIDDSNTASSAYGVSGIPSTFVIGRDGQIVWNCVGAIDWSNPTLRAALRRLL